MHSRRAAPHAPMARLWAIVTGAVRCPALQADFRRLPERRRPRRPGFCRPGAPLRQADKRQSSTSTGALCLRGGRLPPVAPAAHNRICRPLRYPLGRWAGARAARQPGTEPQSCTDGKLRPALRPPHPAADEPRGYLLRYVSAGKPGNGFRTFGALYRTMVQRLIYVS